MAAAGTDLHRLNQQQMATLLGLSTRQVSNLERQDMPGVTVAAGKKSFDGPVIIAWYWHRKLAEAVEEAAPKDEWDAKARLDNAKAMMTELDLAERRGTLLTADYVASQLERILTHLKDSIGTLQGKYAQRFVGLKTITAAQAEWRKATNDLLRTLSEVGNDPALDEIPERKAAA